MGMLYADEDFPFPVVEELRRLGHDFRTVQEAGRAGQGIADEVVLADAIANQRAVLTCNHADFKRLHRQGVPHKGIVSYTQDPTDSMGLTQRIHDAISPLSSLTDQFIRVTRPNRSAKP